VGVDLHFFQLKIKGEIWGDYIYFCIVLYDYLNKIYVKSGVNIRDNLIKDYDNLMIVYFIME
jgi:hypothetical protein